MKKYILFILMAFFLFQPTKSEYWKKIENLPKSAEKTQWLDVFFLDEYHGWVCGRSFADNLGKVARTTDGGKTWSVATLPIWFLESVHFSNVYNGFCSGPDGVYKTIDGGVTWSPISYLNNLLGLIDIWGCYMLNNDTVYVAGGGCYSPQPTAPLQDHRLIWRTTNGGTTWQYFDLSYIPVDGTINYYSGLTDVVVHPNGTGFASSSGIIWKTENYGDTWELASKTSNALSWQEEITNIVGTNILLVPFSGLDCAGGIPNIGGMRFATDATNPATWKERLAAGPMYGSFLSSPTEGWACGTYRGVYYTNNSGDSWQLRNCGIEAGDNLDDIFFVTPQKGWVVGDNIYTLAPSEMLVDKDTIDFGDSCTSRIVYDTLTIKNMNFGSSVIDISIYQNNPSFSIVQPSYLNYPVPSCGEVKLIVKYAPKTPEKHRYSIIINMSPTDELGTTHKDTIYYFGTLREFTARADKDTVDFGDIPIGTSSYKTLRWTSQALDTIIKHSFKILDSSVVFNSSITDVSMANPFVISDSGAIMRFMLAPVDTGDIYIYYNFVFSACGEERQVVLKARGLSPILECKTKHNINILCKSDTVVKIPIYNSGNTSLEIYKIEFDSTSQVKYFPEIISFSNGQKLPIIIEQKKYDTLYVKFNSMILDTQEIKLNIFHNDTKRKSSIFPTQMNFKVIFYKTILSSDEIKINFGDVCIGDTITRLENIKNLSNQSIVFSKINKIIPDFHVSSPADSILAGNSASYSMKFHPHKVGFFADTLKISASPCDEKFIIVLTGRGVENNISINPKEIKDKLNINITKEYKVSVKSNSIQPIEITHAEFIPNLPYITITLLDEFPMNLLPNSTNEISFSINSDEMFTYSGTLILHLESVCFDTIQIPINIEFINNIISYTNNKHEPITNMSSYKTCSAATNYDTIWVFNTQEYIFNSLYFEYENLSEYKIISIDGELPEKKLPAEVESNSKTVIITSFTTTQECDLYNKLIFEMIDKATGEIKFDTLYLHNEFYKTNTKYLLSDDFNNSINFGLFETCDKDTTIYLVFYNTGKLTDTLNISSNLPDYYNISTNKLILEPNKPDSISIVFYPNKIINTKVSHIDTLQINTSVCPIKFNFELLARIEEIELEITPNILDFEQVWINTQDTLELLVKNISNFDIELDKINITPKENFHISSNLPKIIPQNSEIKLPIVFFADKTDFYSAEVEILAKRSCTIEKKVFLQATVPVEKYFLSARFDSTKSQPGATTTISAYIDLPAPALEATGIKFSINMNNLLFFPEKVYLLTDNNKKELEFDFSFADGLSSEISGQDANHVLSTKNKFLEISGLALLYQPDETPINFNKFDITTNKFYELIQTDGNFKLKDYCGENGLFRSISFLPIIKPNYQEIINNNILNIHINSTGESFLKVQLVNSIGEIALSDIIFINKGESEYNFNIINLANGIYSIRFQAGDFLISSGKIIIAK